MNTNDLIEMESKLVGKTLIDAIVENANNDAKYKISGTMPLYEAMACIMYAEDKILHTSGFGIVCGIEVFGYDCNYHHFVDGNMDILYFSPMSTVQMIEFSIEPTNYQASGFVRLYNFSKLGKAIDWHSDELDSPKHDMLRNMFYKFPPTNDFTNACYATANIISNYEKRIQNVSELKKEISDLRKELDDAKSQLVINNEKFKCIDACARNISALVNDNSKITNPVNEEMPYTGY